MAGGRAPRGFAASREAAGWSGRPRRVIRPGRRYGKHRGFAKLSASRWMRPDRLPRS